MTMLAAVSSMCFPTCFITNKWDFNQNSSNKITVFRNSSKLKEAEKEQQRNRKDVCITSNDNLDLKI